VQAALSEIAGVTEAAVTRQPDQAIVKIESGKVTTDALMAAVTGAGFSATVQN
jgi:copper chaperone CopZ